MINLEVPKKLRTMAALAHEVAANLLRPISRKYDTAEHTYPVELDTLRAILAGMADGGRTMGTGGMAKDKSQGDAGDGGTPRVRNGGNMMGVLQVEEMSWGDIGLMLTIPGQGLGNAAITAVATPEQKQRFAGKWAAMAITEPAAGSDSASIGTTARLDGDEWVLDGEKIFVTAGSRADLVVVWATVDKSMGRAAIKSFVVPTDNPGLTVTRVESKLGIRASDTASISLVDCRIPRENLLGSEEVIAGKGFAGVMETFDNTRPVVAAMACGVARAALERTRTLLAREGVELRQDRPQWSMSAAAAELLGMEAELEAARLLTLKAAWMGDNGHPNSLQASMAKAKAGRVATAITLRCVELCGPVGYGHDELLEKWARDAKILDIFEGTQQIQQLIVARRLLHKSSRELR